MTTTSTSTPATSRARAVPAHVPVSDADPFALDTLADPNPLHEALREAGPVVHLSRYGVYALARYEEVHTALVDWQSFCSSAGVGLSNFRHEEPWRPPSLLLEADPPRHDAPRVVLEKVLSPRALRRLRERWVADAHDLVDDLLSRPATTRGGFEAAREIAQAFPLRVFPDAVGLPAEGRENLLPYGDHTFNAFGPPNELVARGTGHIGRTSAWVAAQCAREVLAPEGFGAQIWAASDTGDISPQQAPLIVRSLLTAGVDTTVHGIGAVLYAFASNPEQYERVRAEPRLLRVAFDEAVRWESPVQTFFRTAEGDVRIGDTVVPDGEKVLMFLASANRDPRRWEDPDTFDLTRDPSGHVGFGMGIHQCVGQHVARLEAEAVMTALLERVERIELVGEPRRHLNNTLRAWASMPLRFHTA
ncbi:cytochrome P450 [Kineococcus arenarius]|uniref:cytochrome P450 n=1 Tax=unclassified Kineococcus TaxID=2621656 RepID=UPI003D7DFEF0